MRILFLNQYFPPDPAPTGMLMDRLGCHLRECGHVVDYIASPQSYHTRARGPRRLVRELVALISIFLRGLRAIRPDIVISGTSPPCLLVAATILAARHRARNIHWLMDMYPELALALGEIKIGFVSKVIKSLMNWAYHRADLVVALDDDMVEELRHYGIEAEVIQPWLLQSSSDSPNPGDNDLLPEQTWVYSGNLGRAHEWETLLQVQLLLEKKNLPYRLIFQGGGPSWSIAQARAAEVHLQRCEWRPYVPEGDLRRILNRSGVLIVTQRPETKGMLWPSKLSLVCSLSRPVLWIGPTDGAIADKLRKLPNAGVFAPGETERIAGWLHAVFTHPGGEDSAIPVAFSQSQTEAMDKWGALLGTI